MNGVVDMGTYLLYKITPAGCNVPTTNANGHCHCDSVTVYIV